MPLLLLRLSNLFLERGGERKRNTDGLPLTCSQGTWPENQACLQPGIELVLSPLTQTSQGSLYLLLLKGSAPLIGPAILTPSLNSCNVLSLEHITCCSTLQLISSCFILANFMKVQKQLFYVLLNPLQLLNSAQCTEVHIHFDCNAIAFLIKPDIRKWNAVPLLPASVVNYIDSY